MFSTVIAFLLLLCRKRRPNDRRTGDNIQREQECTNNAHSNVSFNNPVFREDPIYDTIYAATETTTEANLKQAKQEGLLELRIPDGKGNSLASEFPLDDRNTGWSNPTYAVSSLACKRLEEQYAAVQEKGTSYEVLRPNSISSEVANPLHGDNYEYPRPMEAQTHIYMDIKVKKEPQA